MRSSLRILLQHFLPSNNAMSLEIAQPIDEVNGALSSDNVTNILPPGGHEISLLLSLTMNGVCYPFGSLHDDLSSSPPFLIRLGTRVDDNHPSCIGFRIMMRNRSSNPQPMETMEDAFHIKSFKFKPDGKKLLRHSAASIDDLVDIGATIAPDSLAKIRLHRIDFEDASGAFEETSHGSEPDTSIADVSQVAEIVKYLNRCQKISLFFVHDQHVISLLEQTIRQGCRGLKGPVWSDALPSSLVPSWPSNNQLRMVTGSSDIVNVLQRALREPVLNDASVTALNLRPKAKIFKKLVETLFPSLRRESNYKLSPILLNVSGGRCFELPFGGSMFNSWNSYSAMNILHKMLDSGLAPTDIGIVAFYPSQVQCYEIALATCHRHNPQRGYDLIKVATLDDWASKEIDFAIVDLVRTSNASGNLGFLSQIRRVKIALTLHRNGLIIVGDRKCTINAEGNILSTKLEKVFKWLEDNNRVIDMDEHGEPINQANQDAWRKHAENATHQSIPHQASDSVGTTFPDMRQYVGILDLERDIEKLQNTTSNRTANDIISTLEDIQPNPQTDSIPSQTPPAKDSATRQFRKIPTSDKVAASSSFARQAQLLSTQNDVQRGDDSPQATAGRIEGDREYRAQSAEANAPSTSSPVSNLQATPTPEPGQSQQVQQILDMPLSARSVKFISSSPSTPKAEPVPAKKHEQDSPTQYRQGKNSHATEPDTETTALSETTSPLISLRKLLEEYRNSNAAQNGKNAATSPQACAAAKPPVSPAVKAARRPREIPEEDHGKRLTPITPMSPTSPVSKEENATPKTSTVTVSERLRQQIDDIKAKHSKIGSTAFEIDKSSSQNRVEVIKGFNQPIPFPVTDHSNFTDQPTRSITTTPSTTFIHQLSHSPYQSYPAQHPSQALFQPPNHQQFDLSPPPIPQQPSHGYQQRQRERQQQPSLSPSPHPNFRAHYLPKYNSIRSVFDTLRSSSVPSYSLPAEDRLFRQMGEAFITEDSRAFDLVYAELLELARGMEG